MIGVIIYLERNTEERFHQIWFLLYQKKTPFCIANTDDSKSGGEHWVAIVYRNKKEIIVYDSYGRETDDIMDLSYKNKETIETDMDAEQKINTNECGQRCLAWLIYYEIFGEIEAMKI